MTFFRKQNGSVVLFIGTGMRLLNAGASVRGSGASSATRSDARFWRYSPSSYERLFVKLYLQKNRKKVDNQQKMIPQGCFCLAPIRVL